MSGEPDPLYVRARAALLDATDALAPFLEDDHPMRTDVHLIPGLVPHRDGDLVVLLVNPFPDLLNAFFGQHHAPLFQPRW